MTGTIFSYSQNVNPITSDNFSEDDFKTSMALSVGIYSQKQILLMMSFVEH